MYSAHLRILHIPENRSIGQIDTFFEDFSLHERSKAFNLKLSLSKKNIKIKKNNNLSFEKLLTV